MREQVIQKVLDSKIVTIVRGIYGEDCLKLAKALCAGGIQLLEVTFDQRNVELQEKTVQTIQLLCEQMGDQMCFGAGTVTSVKMVQMAKEAGAQFIVSPNMKKEVIEETVALGMVSMPGAMTPTEIMDAYEYGADFVKVFPAGNLGPAYMKSVCAPISHVPLLAVGGIDEKNTKEFLKAGAVGVGVGGRLANKQWIESGEFDQLTALAKEFVEQTK